MTMPEGTQVLTGSGAGNGAGAGAAGSGAGAGSADAGGAAAAAAAASAAAGGAAKPWYGEVAPEIKTWVDGKAYKDPSTALAAHMAAEKLIGLPADRVIKLPEKADDAAGWSEVWNRMGRPEKPEGYELPTPEGQGREFADTAAKWFHAAGVPKSAAQAIAKEWNTFLAAEVAKAEDADQRKSAAELATLRTQWGAAAGEREELARRGLQAFGKQAGMDDADLIKLENSIGTVKMLKLFSEIGKLTAESSFRGGNQQSFTLTKEEANAKIAQLRSNPEWATAYLKGDANKVAEMTQLMEIANAGA
jgi:hypothetical protein